MLPDEYLERAAKAVYETEPVGERPWQDAPALTRERCFIVARAAIEAVIFTVKIPKDLYWTGREWGERPNGDGPQPDHS